MTGLELGLAADIDVHVAFRQERGGLFGSH
jgi:hypothetical protein